jgi:outer membrane protein TolC
MDRFRKPLALLLALAMLTPSGCLWQNDRSFEACAPPGSYEQVASQIEYPAETACTVAEYDESLASPHPWTINTSGTPEYWDISLAEVIQLALTNSRVLRDLGGAVVRTPDATRTAIDPAIAETDPQFGIEAALSEFDAQFLTSVFWEKNDRALNNEFFGGGTRILQQDLGVFQAAITKRAATGSLFTIRHNVDYDANNAPGNAFPSAWNTNVEMEFRHPFLQGSGVQFNRIAGPNNLPGFYDGVLIARLNADVALNDFEIAVRDLVSNVENAYWDLYFGYRVLDARVAARDAALDTWRKIYALYEVDRGGGEAEKEAQAREQFFRFQQDVQNAMSGEPYEQTRNWNGLPSGAFRTTGGVLFAERRLRLLMGMPPSDGRLMRPIDEPVIAKIDFDWSQVTSEATTRRVELRRQKFQIRRRELELIASKNHLLPRLDAVGRYRWRGFGDELLDPNGGHALFEPNPMPPPALRAIEGSNAYGVLTGGDFQEWQLGFELSMPIGFRLAHVAARNAELLLARERALLRDQQREIVHEAADAIAELDRSYAVLQSSYNRLVASQDQLRSVEAAFEADKVPLDLLLDAQRRRAEALVDYTQNRARYAIAQKNVHFVKGTLLEYDGIYLAEGPWPGEAYEDAAKREESRSAPRPMNYASSKSPAVSIGPHAQHAGGSANLLHQAPAYPKLEAIQPFEMRELPPAGGDNLPPPETGAAAAPSAASAGSAASAASPSTVIPASATTPALIGDAAAVPVADAAPPAAGQSADAPVQPASAKLRLPPPATP